MAVVSSHNRQKVLKILSFTKDFRHEGDLQQQTPS
jgi:hypothetical protein